MADAEPPESRQLAVVESPGRLPFGWTERLDFKDGEEVKFYYNVITGLKFYSEAHLLQYVELGIPSQGTRQRTRAHDEGNPENRLMQTPAATKNAPEWLPQGWIVELSATSNGSKYKTYIDPSTGRKFQSKPQILKYLNSDECNDPMSKQIAVSIVSASNALPEGISDHPEWLPEGWITEVKFKSSGKKFKRYIDPFSRQKFYSKPEVERFLNSGKSNDPASVQTAMIIVSDSNKPEGSQGLKGKRSKSGQKRMCSSNSRQKDVEVLRYEAERLPPGWIKEIKIERKGEKIRRDPFYTDPDSKYVFRSLPDALRYLETKDIKACSVKPRKREELEFLTDDVTLHPQKPEESQGLKGASSTSSQKPICFSYSPQKDVEVLRYEAEQLPPGWIKEIKIERKGDKIRRDPFYTDPDSKYVFRSIPDALRYVDTKDIKACAVRPRKREELVFLTDDMSLHISGEKQLLLFDNNKPEVYAEKEENHNPTSGQLETTPGSKRKRGRPVVAPSPNNMTQKGKSAEVSIEYMEMVPSSTCKSSTQIAESKFDSEYVISEEATAARDNIVGMEEKGSEKNLEQQPLERLGGNSSLYPCLDFAFKTLRGDIPVEANNLAAQGYNHQKRASINVGLPSFSDFARRQM